MTSYINNKIKIRVSHLLFGTFLAIACFSCNSRGTQINITNAPDENTPFTITDSMLLPQCSDGIFVKHTAHYLCFDESHRQSKWVAYRLTAEKLQNPIVERRTGSFLMDPELSNSPKHSDYTNSGYDRGHLMPAADCRWSESVMRESFYMSNVSPQPPGLNRGVWSRLEEAVREWTKVNGEIFIITAGVLREDLKKIEQSDICIPEKFYKILFDLTPPDLKMIGFVMANENSPDPLENFAVTVDSVQSLTGIDFFYFLPDSLEQALEGEIDISKWF